MFNKAKKNFNLYDFSRNFDSMFDKIRKNSLDKQECIEKLSKHHWFDVSVFDRLVNVVEAQIEDVHYINIWLRFIAIHSSHIAYEIPEQQRELARTVFEILTHVQPHLKDIESRLERQLPFLKNYARFGDQTPEKLKEFIGYYRKEMYDYEQLVGAEIVGFLEEKEQKELFLVLNEILPGRKWNHTLRQFKHLLTRIKLARIAKIKVEKRKIIVFSAITGVLFLILICNKSISSRRKEVAEKELQTTEELHQSPIIADVAMPFHETKKEEEKKTVTSKITPVKVKAIKLTNKNRFMSYKLRKGDTVYSIAKMFGVTQDAIKDLNKYDDAAVISKGTIIKIPLKSTYENQKRLLAKLLYGEMRNQPDELKKAVAFVMLHRLLDGGWGETLADVILGAQQFSCFNPSTSNYAMIKNLESGEKLPPLDKIAWDACQRIADEAMSGTILDPVNGMRYYHQEYNWKWVEAGESEIDIFKKPVLDSLGEPVLALKDKWMPYLLKPYWALDKPDLIIAGSNKYSSVYFYTNCKKKKSKPIIAS